MADVRIMLVVVVTVVVAAGVAQGFVVEQPDGPDSAWRFSSVDGNYVEDETEQGGHLVGELKDFQIKGFGTYNAGRGGGGGGGGGAGVDDNGQFSDHGHSTLVDDSPEQLSANRFHQEQFDTQEGDDEEGYVYNVARFQRPGASMFETSGNDVKYDVSEVNGEDSSDDATSSYDYNRFSTRSEGFSAPASSQDFNRETSSYVLGVPEEREGEEPRPDYVYDARTERGTDSGNGLGNADHDTGSSSASFTSTDSVQEQQEGSSGDEVKGHEGPVSYYTPASDRNGAFVFYDTRSDEEKKSSAEEDDDSSGSASFASIDSTTSASTPPQGSHGCPTSYWAEHVEEWPSPLKMTTLVSQAFGRSTVKKNLEIIYGTTTLFQALLDTRNDPYSKLLRHAVAALLNSHAKSDFTLRPHDVANLFNAALASKAAAAAQAQRFENENHTFGDINDDQCK